MPPRQIPQVGPGGHVYKDGVPLDERETRSAWEQPDTPVNTPPPAQDADPNFTKFVDAPDEPLPFYALKMIAGIVLIIGGGYLLYQSAQLGTFRLLALHAKDNIRGLPVMLAGIAWLVAGIAGFFSKFKKGAAGLALLERKGKTKYWLYQQLGMSYQNFSKMVNNQTKSIRYENIEVLCQLLDCTPNELFTFTDEQ